MKKYFFLLLLSTLSLIKAQTPANTATQPPQVIAEKFKSEHPDITPSWHQDGKNFVAEFVDPDTFKGISIVYDPQGNIIRRESEMENSSYPAGINDYYIKKYPGERFKTWRSTDDKGLQSYYIKRSSGTIWFDNEGNYLDPEKKNEATAASR